MIRVVLLSIVGSVIAFSPSSLQRSRGTNSRLMANVLEGKEIEKDFTPINNMLLVKKADAVEKTHGGLILTGKVSTVLWSLCSRFYELSLSL
jgi:hypothetical protein